MVCTFAVSLHPTGSACIPQHRRRTLFCHPTASRKIGIPFRSYVLPENADIEPADAKKSDESVVDATVDATVEATVDAEVKAEVKAEVQDAAVAPPVTVDDEWGRREERSFGLPVYIAAVLGLAITFVAFRNVDTGSNPLKKFLPQLAAIVPKPPAASSAPDVVSSTVEATEREASQAATSTSQPQIDHPTDYFAEPEVAGAPTTDWDEWDTDLDITPSQPGNDEMKSEDSLELSEPTPSELAGTTVTDSPGTQSASEGSAGSLPAEAVVQSQEQSPVIDVEVPLPIEAAPVKITPPVQSEGSKAAESLLATLDAPTPPHPQAAVEAPAGAVKASELEALSPADLTAASLRAYASLAQRASLAAAEAAQAAAAYSAAASDAASHAASSASQAAQASSHVHAALLAESETQLSSAMERVETALQRVRDAEAQAASSAAAAHAHQTIADEQGRIAQHAALAPEAEVANAPTTSTPNQYWLNIKSWFADLQNAVNGTWEQFTTWASQVWAAFINWTTMLGTYVKNFFFSTKTKSV